MGPEPEQKLDKQVKNLEIKQNILIKSLDQLQSVKTEVIQSACELPTEPRVSRKNKVVQDSP
jgi:hypothetical protein